MTDAELKDLVASLAISQKETDRQLKETDQRLEKKLDQLRAALDLTDQRLEKKLAQLSAGLELTDQRLEKKLDRLNEIVGGISNNNGFFAEDLFIAALEKRPRIGTIKFDSLHAHYKGASRKGFEYEYDILLQNGAYIGLVEVKYRLHPEAVRKFATEALPRFKEIFPQFADKKLVGAVASTSIPIESLEEAKNYGLAVLAQEGQEIRVLSEEVKEY